MQPIRIRDKTTTIKKPMIQIKPKEIGIPSKTATYIEIRVELLLHANKSNAFYKVFNEDKEQLIYGNLDIVESVHNAWGVDDSIIENYVLEQLGLEKTI